MSQEITRCGNEIIINKYSQKFSHPNCAKPTPEFAFNKECVSLGLQIQKEEPTYKLPNILSKWKHMETWQFIFCLWCYSTPEYF